MFLLIFIGFAAICGIFFEDLNVTKIEAGGLVFPKVLWEYWDEDALPEDVEEMVSVSRKTLALTNFTFCLLTPCNLSEFLDTSTFPVTYSTLSSANKADFIRINLIVKFGGIWVDAPTYITSASEFEWFFSEGVKAKREVYGFDYGGGREFLLSEGFFGASEGSVLMKRQKEEFDISLHVGREEYLAEVCKKLRPIKAIRRLHCNPYFTMFATFIKITYNNESLRGSVLLLPTDRDHEVLIRKCKYDRDCVRHHLLFDPVARAQPFIKVWHTYRDGKKFHIGDSVYELNLKKSQKESPSKKLKDL